MPKKEERGRKEERCRGKIRLVQASADGQDCCVYKVSKRCQKRLAMKTEDDNTAQMKCTDREKKTGPRWRRQFSSSASLTRRRRLATSSSNKKTKYDALLVCVRRTSHRPPSLALLTAQHDKDGQVAGFSQRKTYLGFKQVGFNVPDSFCCCGCAPNTSTVNVLLLQLTTRHFQQSKQLIFVFKTIPWHVSQLINTLQSLRTDLFQNSPMQLII